ncbi:MAG TPA: GntR family transcriptional regulator [Acidimicrobiia bacterium]|nr:GntR family transcriptional regulator [Acidimicrobiia bacterium]
MAKTASGGTRADGVQDHLRAEILGGRRAPGERLKFPELCEHYEVSVGVVREALTRLVDQGLVRAQAHQGYVVTPLSHKELGELTVARMELESLVFRLAVVEGDMAWEAGAVAAHHVLERAPFAAEGDPSQLSEEWAGAHAAFHVALLAGCGNRRLQEMAWKLREEAELYRRWSVSLGQEPTRDIAGEHRRLLDAALARQPELAAERLADHISHTARLLISCADDEHVYSAERAS